MDNDKLHLDETSTTPGEYTPNPTVIKAALTEYEKDANPLSWQNECGELIKNEHNVILSSPTGSGKTRVFLEWAKRYKEEAEQEGKRHTVYITAPIKALSNQRFRELQEQGINVGLETGDIKDVPEDADYICCTQEIYTNKYVNDENATLVMDEFHYIFESPERARTYVDSLHYSKAQNVLLASATFGDTQKFQDYVNLASGRQFYNYENNKRITSLEYKGEIEPKDIKDALVVSFAAKNCRYIAESLSRRRDYDENRVASVYSLADKMNINNDELLDCCEKGVSFYFGAMLPKEKFFVEKLFEQRNIDTVVGTDALALGVNFPVQKIVFTQLAKYYDGPISKNLFEQLAGRAGRKGYFDNGEVYFCEYFGGEAEMYRTDSLFQRLLTAKNEDASIKLTPDIEAILTNKVTIDEEVSYINKYSTVARDEERLKEEIEDTIDHIQNYHVFAEVGEHEENYDFPATSYFMDCLDDDDIYYEDEDGEMYYYDDDEVSDNVRNLINNYSWDKQELNDLRDKLESGDSDISEDEFSEREKRFNEQYAEVIKKEKTVNAIGSVFDDDEVSESQIEAMEELYGDDLYFVYRLKKYRHENSDEYKKYLADSNELTREFQENIPRAYFSEYSKEKNCELFEMIIKGANVEDLAETTKTFADLLQLRKYLRQLPKKYKSHIDFSKLDTKINDIDETALRSNRSSMGRFKNLNESLGE